VRRTYRWEIAFFLITIGWGATFVTVKDAVAIAPPLLFMAIRFSISAALLALVGPRSLFALSRRQLLIGCVTGVFLFSGYAFQTAGVQYTTASNAGFITGLFVVCVPLFGAIALRRLPSVATLFGVALATAGLFLLSRPSGGLPNKGDLMILGTAASFGVQILVVGRFASEIPPLAFASVQLGVTGILSGAGSLLFEPHVGLGSGTVWIAVAITVLVATTIPFWVQAAGQRHVPPTRAAIIFTGEPVFAALFGTLVQHDPVTVAGIAGAVLILSGMLVAELLAPEREAV
jgi:drug/metabolite transporter (DMT)-like permease